MEISPVRTELSHTDRQTGWHDEAHIRSSQFCKRV